MALDLKPQHIAIAGGAAIIAGMYLARGSPAMGAIAITGPTEETSRELIRAGVETYRIGSEERIAFEEIRASERVAIHGQVSEENIARSFTESLNIRTRAEQQVALTKLKQDEQQNAFDFIGGFFRLLAKAAGFPV